MRPTPDGRTPAAAARSRSATASRELVGRRRTLLPRRLVPALADARHRDLLDWDELDEDDRKHLVEVFEQRVFPVLTPLAVDPGHPFPYISNLSLNLARLVARPRQPASALRPREGAVAAAPVRRLPDGARFVPLEQVIAAQLDSLFPGMVVEDRVGLPGHPQRRPHPRGGGGRRPPAAVEMELRRRRFGRAVRLEVEDGISAEMLDLLLRELDLEPDDVSSTARPLDLTGLFRVHALDRADLKDEPWPPATQARLADAAENDKSIFSVLRERDVLVHHPYDSFAHLDRGVHPPGVETRACSPSR